MQFAKIAGYKWSPQLVDWGSAGPGNKASIKGYYPKKLDGSRGRLTNDEIKRRTTDFWSVHCVYTLFQSHELLYVGEGILGDCLYRHHREDEFVGRWDSFSWISPWSLDSAPDPVVLKPWDETAQYSIKAKDLIEQLETVLICLTEPTGNRQTPWDEKSLMWLEQVRPEGYSTLEEKIDRLLEHLNVPPPKP